MIKPSPAPARSSPRRLPWKCLRPSHRKPARLAKEMPDPSWRKARPGSTFYCASCTQAVGQADVLAGPRDPPPRPGAGQAPRGHARSSRPRRRLLTLATSRAKWKRGPKRNLPRLTHPERLPQAGGGGPASGGSRKVSRSGARGKRAGPRPRAREARSGGKGAQRGRERTHLGEEAVHCSRAPRDVRAAGVPLAAVSPAQGPGKPCASRRDAREPEPAAPRGCHRLLPARRPHLLFAQTQVSSSSVPNAAFVSSSSKFLTLGHSARERRTAGGTFFPAAAGARREARECAPVCLPLCLGDPAAGARRGQRYSGHKASPESLSAREHSRREY